MAFKFMLTKIGSRFEPVQDVAPSPPRKSVALDYNWRLLFTAYEVIFKKHWESKSLLNIVTHYPMVKKAQYGHLLTIP